MPRVRIRTAVLSVVVIGLGCRLLWKRAHQPLSSGTGVLLVHRCGWKEAFDLLGDDRQVIVRYLPHNQALINEKSETDESLLADVSSIMETRNDRFLWVIADPTLNYGEVATHIAAIKSRTSHLKVLIATQSQIAEVNEAFRLSVKDKSAQMISDCPNYEDLRR